MENSNETHLKYDKTIKNGIQFTLLQYSDNFYSNEKMPRFQPNPNNASAIIPLLPKGTARFKIGEPKAFFNSRKDNDSGETKETYGVRFPLVIVDCPGDPSLVGKRIYNSTYQHNQGSEDAAKRFMLAGYGYPASPAGEDKFGEEIVASKDASFNTESGAVGDYYMGVVGRVVEADVDVKEEKRAPNGVQNQFNNWRPV